MKNIMKISILLLIAILLCACGKQKESRPKNSRGTGASNDISDSSADDTALPDDAEDFDFDFNNPDDVLGELDYDGGDDESDSDEDEEELVSPPYREYYDKTNIHDPVKVLTNQETIEQCLTEGLIVKRTVVNAGIGSPVTVARITDSHLAYVNGADNAVAREQAAIRYQSYTNADKKLERCVKYAKASGAHLVAFTGDIFDYFSMGNLEKFKSITKTVDDMLFCLGEHDDARKAGEILSGGEDLALIRQTVGKYVKNDLSFAAKRVGEITVVSMDNSRHIFTASQVEKMKLEIANGRPILVMIHTPLYSESLFQMVKENQLLDCVMGYPDAVVAANSGLSYMDANTKEMVELIHSNPGVIKGVFAGHLQQDSETLLPGGIPQYLLRASFQDNGCIEMIEVR